MKNLFTKAFLTFLMLACIATVNFAKEQPKGINLIKENNGYKVDFVLPDYYLNNTLADGNNYFNLQIPEYGVSSEVGKPNLPQISFSIFVSYDENIPVIKVLNQVQETKILSSKIFPVQQPWSKNLRLEDRPFTIDADYYKSSGNINGPFVKISEPFVIAGVKGVMITVYPFAYDPSSNILKVTKSGSFRIQLSSEPEINFLPTKSFNEFYNVMFLNYNPNRALGTGRYLIITAPAYESGLTPLVTEKTGLGYTVSVVNTGVTGTTNTAIKAYIQSQYDNIATRPEFVLLVGDIDVIPEWIGIGEGTPHTDLNYSMLDGTDPFADVFLGRFPIQNTTQLSNIISKTLYMESAINGLPKKNVFCASSDNWAITEATHNFCIDSFFVAPPNVNTTLFCHTDTATTPRLTSTLSANQTFAIYSGHGSETSWADGPPLNQSQVNALTNTVFPYVYSFACITGSYHIAGECFSETWIRIPKGGVVFWGSSVNSYWDEDDILQRRTFRAVFKENLKKTSPSFVLGKYLLVQFYGSVTATMRRYLEMYNCMGDPSIYMDSYAPKITHAPLTNTENLSGPYVVNCTIEQTVYPINTSTAKVFWTRGTVFSDSVNLVNTSGNNYTANIPGNGTAANYRYYIKVADDHNYTSYSPGGAPASYYSFTASTDLQKPVITHSALPNCPKTAWPSTVTAAVTDNIGVDSAWVRWKKGTNGTTKQFKLLFTSGNNYAAAFNSTQAEVNFGDTIFYRIIAQDNSSNHNRDSSALYSFNIISQTTVILGNGTVAMGSASGPYNTYWYGNRTQLLYTAAEILAAGGGAGMISKMGFQISVVGGQAMTGLNFRVQNTTQTTVTSYVTSGWTTVYNGTYTVPGTGWQYVEFTSPFYWNGTSNLLFEICFGNTSYTTATTVYGTSMSGMEITEYHDLSTACSYTGFTSPTAQTARANTSFVINTAMGTGTNFSSIPKNYSLSQNYPNPFNPVTKINFDVPKQGLVSIKIFDILGREVKTLVNEVKAPGMYSVDFNGTELSSGVYFYRMEANGFMDIKRMVLIK